MQKPTRETEWAVDLAGWVMAASLTLSVAAMAVHSAWAFERVVAAILLGCVVLVGAVRMPAMVRALMGRKR